MRTRVFVGVTLVASFLLSTEACSDLCGNRVIETVLAPEGKTKALVFERDCGATTDFSTHVSILDGSEALPRTAGNVFTADGDHGAATMTVRVHWVSPNHLVVSFPARARVFRQQAEVSGVRISYEKTP
jgi:hypothetical protein